MVYFEDCNIITSENEINGDNNYFILNNYSLNSTIVNIYSSIYNDIEIITNNIKEILITQPFICLTSNKLILNNCNFKGFKCTSEEKALITINSGNIVDIEGCTFVRCKRESGKGGVIYVELGTSGSSDNFTIGNSDNVKFESCSASKGGAIYLTINNNNQIYLLKNLVFLNNKADYGDNFFIEGYDISTIAKK